MSGPTEPDHTFVDALRAERRDVLNRLRRTRLSTLKPGYSHAQVIPHATYSPWLDDRTFADLHREVRDHTLVDVYRCHALFSLAQQASRIDGDIVEVGVWRGGTAALLAAAAPGKCVHLFDTFVGVVKAEAQFDTRYVGGEHGDTDEQTVRGLFARLSLGCALHRGMFPEETLGALPALVAMAHVDVDTYRSARDAALAIWPVVSSGGGVIVFDDYGFFGCEGVTLAVQELARELRGAYFVHNLNGQALLIKVG